MNDTIMAEEMQPETKVAFAQRKYSNEEKRKQEEEELEQLMKEQRGEVEKPEEEPASSEEKTFKKRYGDLRRHMQEKEKDFQKQLEELKGQLDSATRKEMKLPKSDEDLEAWARDYPDVAAIIETIAAKKAKEQTKTLEDRFKAVDEMQVNAQREKAEAELMRLHPDFDEIRDSDDFHEWADEQPNGYRKHSMRTMMTLVLLPVLLTCTNQTRTSRLRKSQKVTPQKLSHQKILEASRKRMRHLLI